MSAGALFAAAAQFGFAAKAIFIKLAYAAHPGLDAVTLLALRMIFSLPFFLFMARPITRRVAIALLVSYAGLGLAYWHDLAITNDTSALIAGTGLVFLSAICYAVYMVVGTGLTRRIGSMRFTAYMMLVATFFVMAQFFIMRPLSALDLPMKIYAYSVCLAVFSTAAPVWMMAEALKRIGASDASMIGSVGPVLTIFLGAAFLGEQISVLQLVGAALVLGGVAMISLGRSPLLQSVTPPTR